MASRRTQVIQAMLVALSVAFTVLTFTSVKSSLKGHYHSQSPVQAPASRFLQGSIGLMQELNDTNVTTPATNETVKTYHYYDQLVFQKNKAVKEFGFRSEERGWTTHYSLGLITGVNRVCEIMDCQNYGGTAQGNFLSNSENENEVKLLLSLYNGKYRNEQLPITLEIPKLPDCTEDEEIQLDCFSQTQPSDGSTTLSLKTQDKITVQLQDMDRNIITQAMNYTSIDLNVNYLEEHRYIDLTIVGSEEHYKLTISVEHKKFWKNIFFKSLAFSAFYTFIMSLVLVHSGKQLLEAQNQEALGEKISIISLCIHAFWDLMAGMVFSTESSIFQNSTIPLLIPALMHFVIFVYADLRLLAVAWIHRQRRLNNDPNVIRSNCLKFFLYFYLLLIICVNFLGKFILENAPLALLLYTPLWIPQIISNIFTGAKRVPKLGYVYLFSFMRIYPFLYVTLCPQNLLQLRPSTTYGYTGLILIVSQVILLHIQYVYGGRSLIPKRCRPGYYQYERNFIPPDLENVEGALGHNECIICMQKLMYHPEDHGHHSSNENIIEESDGNKQRAYQYMQTPCAHRYHKKCLTHWLEMREECPICRSKIPPVM